MAFGGENAYHIRVMEKILVSACLLGDLCTYDRHSNARPYLVELNRYYDLIPFCPEVEGGLPTPRDPSEQRGDKVVSNKGKDVTKAFAFGAEKAVAICKYFGVRYAILKERSPSCGTHQIYDGNFSSRVIEGEGVTAAALRKAGVILMNEEEGEAFLEKARREEQSKDEKTRVARIKAEQPKEEPLPEPRPERKPRQARPFRKESKPFRKDGKKPFKKPNKGSR